MDGAPHGVTGVRTVSRLKILVAGAGLIAIALAAVPALQWRSFAIARTRCQSNLRRLSLALLLYAQDHDYRFPIPDYRVDGGRYRTWVDLLALYIDRQPILQCPWNPPGNARHPEKGFTFASSYALNARFWNHFAPGPFPMDNLELPSQTVLLVEAGPEREDGPFGSRLSDRIRHLYWDTGAMPGSYPSPHRRTMNIAAADGHVVNITVAHYSLDGHNEVFGRLGKRVFNWNGGHPNGDTSGPPAE